MRDLPNTLNDTCKERVKRARNSQVHFLKRNEPEKDHQQVAAQKPTFLP